MEARFEKMRLRCAWQDYIIGLEVGDWEYWFELLQRVAVLLRKFDRDVEIDL